MSQHKSKLIGILGGLSWHSTAVYYQLMNQQLTAKLGQDHSARLLINSLDFRDITDLFRTPAKAVKRLVDECQKLESAGCSAIILASNTVHFAYQDLIQALRVPVLHIADAVGDRLQTLGVKRPMLLGTRYTMNLKFYHSRLEEGFGIKPVFMDERHKKQIDQIIYNELVKGILKKESKKVYLLTACAAFYHIPPNQL